MRSLGFAVIIAVVGTGTHANIFSQTTFQSPTRTDDDRHNPVIDPRNSSNPLHLPYFSSRPTYIPTKRPSTHSFSEGASTGPTVRPSFEPTTPKPSPLNETSECHSLAGDFGNIQTRDNLQVIYFYTMELSNSTPPTILTLLEVAITDFLVPSLISSCEYINSRVLSSSSQLAGISSFPPDIVQPDTCTSVITAPITACYLIKGQLTLYLPSTVVRRRGLSSADLVLQTSRTIQFAMDSGKLAESIPAIVKLTYLNNGTEGVSPTSTSVNTVGGHRNTFPVIFAWALLGLFGIVVLGIYAKWCYKRYLKRKDKELTVVKQNGIAMINPKYQEPISFGLMESEWVEFQNSIYYTTGSSPSISPRTLSTASLDDLCHLLSIESEN